MDNSKRRFLRYGFLSGAVLLFDGCNLFGVTTPAHTLRLLSYDLVPNLRQFGFDVSGYIMKLLHNKRIRESDKTFLKNGIKWLNENAIKLYKKEYAKLEAKQRAQVLHVTSQEDWGEDFLADVMRYSFEAMLADPVYGVNKNEAAWKWLDFEGGRPRPQKAFVS